MSLLGVDIGTSACKVAAFSTEGELLASAGGEYEYNRPFPGGAELDAQSVFEQIRTAIRSVTARCAGDPVTALSTSSLGEALVPVTRGREILAPSILNFDTRGNEYIEALRVARPDAELYRTNGNVLGKYFAATKLKWIKEHQPDLYRRADLFDLWGGFVPFMLGGDACVDYSLANRTLLFDLDRRDWSDSLLAWSGLDRDKLPPVVPAGRPIGIVARAPAAELGLNTGVVLVSGAHDQCANAVGCGVIAPGGAVCGMGTYVCITPVLSERRAPEIMIGRGLNTEHHARPDLYVSFIYNQGGSSVKWFRDTFAGFEHHAASAEGLDVYPGLFAEMPEGLSPVLAMADIAGGRGLIDGLNLGTTRGEILKAVLEGIAFDLRARIEDLPPTGIVVDELRATGGGSKSDIWVQLMADILRRPLMRPRVSEAGALGAAILAGLGSAIWQSFEQATEAMVHPGTYFEPNEARAREYDGRFRDYQRLREAVAKSSFA